MNDRLTIATQLLAATRGNHNYDQNSFAAAESALRWADALIAQEAASRPPCEHLRKTLVGPLRLEHSGAVFVRVCADCGAEVSN